MSQSDRGGSLKLWRSDPRVMIGHRFPSGCFAIMVLWRQVDVPIRLGDVVWGWRLRPRVDAWPPFI
jgi:hypothetical protein